MGGVEEKTALEHSRYRTTICCPCLHSGTEGKTQSPSRLKLKRCEPESGPTKEPQ